jgi:hypothetical protein
VRKVTCESAPVRFQTSHLESLSNLRNHGWREGCAKMKSSKY